MMEILQVENGRDARNKSRSQDAERRRLIDAQARVSRGWFPPASRRASMGDISSYAQKEVMLQRKYDNINWQVARYSFTRKMRSHCVEILHVEKGQDARNKNHSQDAERRRGCKGETRLNLKQQPK